MENLQTPEGVKSYMEKATSELDWNNRCDAVKRANGGDYPHFWFVNIIVSGVLAMSKRNWR